MADWQVLITDLETGTSYISFRMMGTSEDLIKKNVARLNKLSKKDFTMNHYSYREINNAIVAGS